MLQAENSWHQSRKNGRVENLRQVERYSNHTNRHKEKKGEGKQKPEVKGQGTIGYPKI